ncbi:hypothetical protein FDA77_00940 [Clostridium botulinum]|nr:hypothetical protein [Clostridium botulinum]NFJ88515.1 hypothetical protein [Clostridium botulinum]HDI3121669.1 hypothetical protein [Clostridium botulinum]
MENKMYMETLISNSLDYLNNSHGIYEYRIDRETGDIMQTNKQTKTVCIVFNKEDVNKITRDIEDKNIFIRFKNNDFIYIDKFGLNK